MFRALSEMVMRYIDMGFAGKCYVSSIVYVTFKVIYIVRALLYFIVVLLHKKFTHILQAYFTCISDGTLKKRAQYKTGIH